MREMVKRRPIISVLILEVAQVVLVVAGAAALGWLFPALPGYSLTGWSQSLVLVLVCAVILLAVLAMFRWWSAAGFTKLGRWRRPSVYWLPALLVLAPFIGGIKPVPASALGILILGYVATAVFEEGDAAERLDRRARLKCGMGLMGVARAPQPIRACDATAGSDVAAVPVEPVERPSRHLGPGGRVRASRRGARCW